MNIRGALLIIVCIYILAAIAGASSCAVTVESDAYGELHHHATATASPD